MSLCSWVNVVAGRMTAIDRAAKHVVVSQKEIVLYDHLILCTGQQYQVPCPTGADISQHLTNREIPNSSKQRYTGKVPCNHFILNDEEDCLKALTWIRNNSIITEGGILPGSYHYLHIAKPAILTPLEVQMAQPDFGSEVVTGNPKNGNYFRIHVNKYKMVETITCLSKEAFPTSNYICLFGQHEQVLNNLCARYEDNMITDLYR
ncbi:cilia and flagella associated protein 61 [Phyllostomus discolor]|uniref:Cilia and flagella associated protein 61 n=1 Tax=Phyllostomus discolor TaxID=89673 RepID=A0A833Z6V0_9CHIR|nr:cilia and flagella associated protein 61 [Phyllostomus discolor]